MHLDSIEDIIDDIRRGRMVIIMDDEDRENEGDLIMAASHVRPADINFMARYGRGLICLTLSRERCQQLRLPQMVSNNTESQQTAFTVSIEAAQGVTTGISAADRAVTINTAVAPNARPEDLVQPGHVFPLMAQPGGVLNRAGHTEAGCDLARLAGLESASVIVEILNEDGTMARRPDLQKFAEEHDLKIGTIADLIRYRIENEHTVERTTESTVHTEYGDFRMVAYEDSLERTLHLALVKGDISDDPTLVRVHLQSTLADIVGVQHESFSWPLRSALARISREGAGVVVILRQNEAPRDIETQIRNLSRSAAPHPAVKGESEILRTYGIGAQILTDLGITKMRVLSNPKKMLGLSGFGLEVVEYVECD